MTKSQGYLIAAILALFGAVICIFRGDMFEVAHRPGVTSFLQNYVQTYGLGFFIILFSYFLAKGFKLKWWLFIALFVFWELTYVFVLNFGPKFLPDSAKLSGWFGHFKGVALDDRSMIQFQDETAQYDKELFYTLKPGKSNFKSFEFDTEYNNNSLGLRDSEESLNFPKVLFLGDSFTMGWGVEQDEAFPQVYENISGVKSLSTGVSSYGTAREYRMMKRVKTDSLEAVVIQFHDTDLKENDFYVKNNKLGDRTQADFDAQVQDNKKYMMYYPFKYLKTALVKWVANMQSKGSGGETGVAEKLGGEYDLFPNYLADFYKIVAEVKAIKDVPVVVLYTGSFYTQPLVIQEFEAYAKKNNIEGVYFINMAMEFDHTDYFYLDDHLNAKGHAKIAKAVDEKLKELIN